MTNASAAPTTAPTGMSAYFKMGWASLLTVPLFLWLVYCLAVSAFGAFMITVAGVKAAWAVGGLVGSALVLLFLLPVFFFAPGAYLQFFTGLPNVWAVPGSSAARKAILTIVGLVFVTVASTLGHGLSTWIVGWIADRNPCASYAAGVTGSKPPVNCPAT